MDREKRIMDEVYKTMQIMDNQKILTENPFFYTRLKARMSGLSVNQVSRSHRLATALKPVGLLLLLLMNIFTALYVVKSGNSTETTTAAAATSSANSEIVKSYRFDQNCYIYNIKDLK